METAIVICLLVVIVLLLEDKVEIKRKPKQKAIQEKVNPNLPNIMGQPKPVRSQSVTKPVNESQIVEPEINPDTLDIEYDENEIVGIQVPQEELDEVFSNLPDFEEEELEWQKYGIASSDNSLAQGVTYEELITVGELLQKENLEQPQKIKAVELVQKLQGTELFSLLENSIEGTSQKIAKLLDSSLYTEAPDSSSTLRNNENEDFDIGEFL